MYPQGHFAYVHLYLYSRLVHSYPPLKHCYLVSVPFAPFRSRVELARWPAAESHSVHSESVLPPALVSIVSSQRTFVAHSISLFHLRLLPVVAPAVVFVQ